MFALPLIWVRGVDVLITGKLGFYVARCVIGMLGMMAGFWAIVHLPLAQAIALSYSSPLFVTIGAVLFLGEIVRMRRWSAVAAGFIGVLIIVRPGAEHVERRADCGARAAMSGMTIVSIKFLSRSEPPDRIVLLTTLLWVPLAAGAPMVWCWPDAATWRCRRRRVSRHRRHYSGRARCVSPDVVARAVQLRAAVIVTVSRGSVRRELMRTRRPARESSSARRSTSHGARRSSARSTPSKARRGRGTAGMTNDDSKTHRTRKRRCPPSNSTSALALAVSIFALAIGAWQTRLYAGPGARQRLAASSVGYTYSSNVDENGFIWRIDNNGVGPARVRERHADARRDSR